MRETSNFVDMIIPTNESDLINNNNNNNNDYSVASSPLVLSPTLQSSSTSSTSSTSSSSSSSSFSFYPISALSQNSSAITHIHFSKPHDNSKDDPLLAVNSYDNILRVYKRLIYIFIYIYKY